MTPGQYLTNLLKLADVDFNVVVLFDRKVETLSRRAAEARAKGKRWGCVLCAILDFFVKRHCEKALAAGEVE